MPCDRKHHSHVWPLSGILVVEKCERYCGYCTGAHSKHAWKYAWFLRRHVRNVHCKPTGDRPDIVVSDEWTDMPGNRRSEVVTPQSTSKKEPVTLDGKRIKKEPKTPSPRKRSKSVSPRKYGSFVKYTTPVKYTTLTENNITPSAGITLGLTEASLDDEDEADDEDVGEIMVHYDNHAELVSRSANQSVDKNVNVNDNDNTTVQEQPIFRNNPDDLKHAFAASVQDLVAQGFAEGMGAKDIQIVLAAGAEQLGEFTREDN